METGVLHRRVSISSPSVTSSTMAGGDLTSPARPGRQRRDVDEED